MSNLVAITTPAQTTPPSNATAAPCRVAERAGFTREGVLRHAHWNPRIGCRRDWAIYSVLRGER